jgi:chloramphenicol 3-O-phosphotransferase
MRRGLRGMFSIGIAALTHHVEKQQRALCGVDRVFAGMAFILSGLRMTSDSNSRRFRQSARMPARRLLLQRP